MDEATKEIVNEAARIAAVSVVEAQAPSRQAEHAGIATRIIRLVFWITLVELAINASAAIYVNNASTARDNCLSGAVTELQHEHMVPTRNYKPDDKFSGC